MKREIVVRWQHDACVWEQYEEIEDNDPFVLICDAPEQLGLTAATFLRVEIFTHRAPTLPLFETVTEPERDPPVRVT